MRIYGSAAAPPRPPEKPSGAERHKLSSNYLRGAIVESLADPLSASLPEREALLLKFHGAYQQDDRDLRKQRAAQKLEPAYRFMLRVRASGGIVMPSQWVALDQLAREYGDGTLRLTARQSLELHGILKWKLQETIHRLNAAGLTSLATCGDVNRNVMCVPTRFRRTYTANCTSGPGDWPSVCCRRPGPIGNLDRAETNCRCRGPEPLYGPSYLPRKFKIAIAVPPRTTWMCSPRTWGWWRLSRTAVWPASTSWSAAGWEQRTASRPPIRSLPAALVIAGRNRSCRWRRP